MPKSIDEIKAGYENFFDTHYGSDASKEFSIYQKHQPKILVITCCDARISPSLLFNARPGDLFVIRNVANLIPPYESDGSYHGTSAAIEFAVSTLSVKHVIVLGHSCCAGIESLFGDRPNGDAFLNKWMNLASNAYKWTIENHKDACIDHQLECCSKQSIINSISNLKTFPFVDGKIETGKLFVHGWYFDLISGSLSDVLNDKPVIEKTL